MLLLSLSFFCLAVLPATVAICNLEQFMLYVMFMLSNNDDYDSKFTVFN